MAVTHDPESTWGRRPARSRSRDRASRRSAARRPAEVAPGLSHRLGAGRVRVASGARQVHRAHERGARGRPVLDCAQEHLRPAAGPIGWRADRERRRTVRRRRQDVHVPRRQHAADCWSGLGRPRSSPTTSNARTSSAQWCPPSNSAGCTALATTAGSTSIPAGLWRARRSAPLPRVLLEMREGNVYATGVEESAT